MFHPDRANLNEGFRERGMRQRMIAEMRAKGIRSEAVLAAMGRVPRHVFFERALLEHAYVDKAFPIGAGQTISQPYTVARQSELLEAREGDRILEIGTGSGYQCAVLCELGLKVYSIEYQPELAHRAKIMLAQLGYKPERLIEGDGSKGLPASAPYAGIIVTAGAPGVPEALKTQLAVGGRLVIPVGTLAQQEMLRITRTANNDYKEERMGDFRFVPLKGQQGWK